MDSLSPETLRWLLGIAASLLVSTVAYLVRRNEQSNDKVADKVEGLTEAVTALKVHLFGATGTNGLNSRVLKLEDRADDADRLDVRLSILENERRRRVTDFAPPSDTPGGRSGEAA